MEGSALYLVQLPPPVHGASIINQSVIKMLEKPGDRVLNLSQNSHLDDVGRFSLGKAWGNLKIIGSVFFFLIIHRPAVVYHTPGTRFVAVLRDAGIALIVKLVLLLPGRQFRYLTHWHSAPDVGAGKAVSALLRFVLNSGTPIFLSEWHKRQFQQIGWRGGKSFIVGNGVVDYADSRALREHRLVGDEPYTFLFLSNMIKSKGYIESLRLAEEVSRLSPLQQFRIVFAGGFLNSEDESAFREMVADTPANLCAEIAGPVYGQDKYALLSASDCLLFPTRYEKEVFPTVILEALQNNLKIVSTRHASIPEMLNDADASLIDDWSASTDLFNYLNRAYGMRNREVFVERYMDRGFFQKISKAFE